MTRRPQHAHWLRENAQERSPRRVLVVDTETRPASDAEPERQVLRLWCARLLRRRGIDPKRPRREDFRGTTAAELADLVSGLGRSDATLWVMCHNLHFDLAVTELPVALAERGWRLTDAALTTDSPWARMARGSRRLTIADTFSWLPTGVEGLGELLGRRKLPLPAWDDPDDAWWARCEVDVDITARAIGGVMDWWDAGRYGNWSITGPATGWSSYRHRRPPPRVLVVPDADARALEMAAVTGGRREARRIGLLAGGLYADLDIETAHLTAMTGLVLPTRRLRPFEALPLDHRALDSAVVDVLARCEVETIEPRYPWDSGRGVFYPVGRFRSVLAGPELREARARGELRSIGSGYLYAMGAHMADWALWIASLLDVATPGVPPTVRLMAKHWSRCVPGKWAGHTSEVLTREPDPRPGWSVERLLLMPSRRAADLLLVGGERWTIVRDEWADDAFPAILAWIQSATRVAIGRLVDRLGPAVVVVNTDGALVEVDAALACAGIGLPASRSSEGRRLRALAGVCADLGPALAPFSVRIKGAARLVRVISPQHLIVDAERRLAGIPHKAVSLAGGRYAFTQWPKLRVQLAEAHPRSYRTVDVEVDLGHVPPPGWLLADGRVEPPVVLPGRDGVDRLQPLVPGSEVCPALQAPDRQHPALRPLLAPVERVA